MVASFWNTETSGQSMGIGEGANTGVEGKTTSEFQEPTGYGGMYAGWLTDLDNVDEDGDETTGKDDVWDFGSTTDYPALKMDIGGDGTATWWESGGQHARAHSYTHTDRHSDGYTNGHTVNNAYPDA